MAAAARRRRVGRGPRAPVCRIGDGSPGAQMALQAARADSPRTSAQRLLRRVLRTGDRSRHECIPAAARPARERVPLTRWFRDQPTPELARSARRGIASAISPNRASSTGCIPGRAFLSYRCSPLPTRASTSPARARAGTHVADHPRDRGGVCRRQAGGHHRVRHARDAIGIGATRAEPAHDRGRRRRRRDRVHRLATDLQPRLPWVERRPCGCPAGSVGGWARFG
jgi:hypothetical protein